MKTIVFACSVKKDLFRIAPIINELKGKKNEIATHVCYCGHTINYTLLEPVKNEIEIPRPDFQYHIDSGNPVDMGSQLTGFFKSTLEAIKPDLVIIPIYHVLALAYCLEASEQKIPVCNLDAGLRLKSEDTPITNYRVPVDVYSSLLLISEESSFENLKEEDLDLTSAYLVGNPLYETLDKLYPLIQDIKVPIKIPWNRFALGYTFYPPHPYDKTKIPELKAILESIANEIPLIIPVHSDPKVFLNDFPANESIIFTKELEYVEYLALMQRAAFVITDSHVIQEECASLNKHCITLQTEAERPSLVANRVNILTGFDSKLIKNSVQSILNQKENLIQDIRPVSGNASKKIVEIIMNYLLNN